MPVSIVYGFEIVYIEHYDRERVGETLRPVVFRPYHVA